MLLPLIVADVLAKKYEGIIAGMRAFFYLFVSYKSSALDYYAAADR